MHDQTEIASEPRPAADDRSRFKGTLIARGLTKSYKGRQVVSGVSIGVRAGGRRLVYLLGRALGTAPRNEVEHAATAQEQGHDRHAGRLRRGSIGSSVGLGRRRGCAQRLPFGGGQDGGRAMASRRMAAGPGPVQKKIPA